MNSAAARRRSDDAVAQPAACETAARHCQTQSDGHSQERAAPPSSGAVEFGLPQPSLPLGAACNFTCSSPGLHQSTGSPWAWAAGGDRCADTQRRHQQQRRQEVRRYGTRADELTRSHIAPCPAAHVAVMAVEHPPRFPLWLADRMIASWPNFSNHSGRNRWTLRSHSDVSCATCASRPD